MKLSILIAIVMASFVMAVPGAVSLERKTRTDIVNGKELARPCVECPCKNWNPNSCKCIPNGCCCTREPHVETIESMAIANPVVDVAESVEIASPVVGVIESVATDSPLIDTFSTTRACVECPCKNGAWSSCHCIPNGCCCEDRKKGGT